MLDEGVFEAFYPEEEFLKLEQKWLEKTGSDDAHNFHLSYSENNYFGNHRFP